jgi:hypothetical protein
VATIFRIRQALASSLNTDPRPKVWTREEFDRLADLGCFRGQRAELIEGEIMVLSPQRPSHTYTTDRVAEILRNSGWPNVWVRMQLPIEYGYASLTILRQSDVVMPLAAPMLTFVVADLLP